MALNKKLLQSKTAEVNFFSASGQIPGACSSKGPGLTLVLKGSDFGFLFFLFTFCKEMILDKEKIEVD